MKQYTQPLFPSKEEHDKLQMQRWLSDSHYWVKVNDTFACEWCGKITTTTLTGDAHLCFKNPALEEFIKEL